MVSCWCSEVFEGTKRLKRAQSVTGRYIPGSAKFALANKHGKPERSSATKTPMCHKSTRGTDREEPEKGSGPSRGGELGPRARSGPGGGGRRRPYRKLIRKGLSDRHRGSYRPPIPYHRTRPHAASANRITTYAARPEKALCRDHYLMVRIFLPVSLCKTPLAGPGSGCPTLSVNRAPARSVYDPSCAYTMK